MFAKKFRLIETVIRTSMIVKTLQEKHNFKCSGDTLKTIGNMIWLRGINNNEIVAEVLEMHTFEEMMSK